MSNAAVSFFRRFASRLPLACALIVFVVLPSVAGAGPNEGPKSPSNLTLTGGTDSELSISWTAPTARRGSAIAGYGLYLDGVSVGSTTANNFTFSGLECATGSSLGVDAVDDAGRRSSIATITATTAACATPEVGAPAPEPLALLATSTTGTAFTPDADARVTEAYASTNYGSSSSLRVDGGSDPDVQTFLRFSVSGLSGSVTSAKLRLYATSPTLDGPAVYATATAWSESGITWSNRPAPAGTASDDKGSISTSTWAEFDVTRLVTGNGAFAFVLVGGSTDGVDFSSRQGSSAPQLIVSTGTATTGDTTAPTAPAGLVASSLTATSGALAWAASTDNVGVAGYSVFVNGTKAGTTSLTSYTASSLTCGTAYTFGVEAYDQAGNVSPRTTVSATTATCSSLPPPSTACSKTLSAGGDLSTFVASLRAGDVGCLRGGTYTDGALVTWSVDGTASSPVTLTEYPGEQAEIVGTTFVLGGDYETVRELTIRDVMTLDYDGLAVDGTGDRVEHNVIKRTARHGILLHTSSRGVTVTRNFISDTGLNSANTYPDHGIYVQGLGGTITSNVFSHMKGYGIHVYGVSGAQPSDYTIAGNTAYGSVEKGGILIDTIGGNIRVTNNISAQNYSYGIINRRCDGGGCVVDHNLVYGNRDGGVSGASTATASTNPTFVDAANANYHLLGTSPAIKAGRSDYSYVDFDGRTRLSPPDLGAFQFVTP